MWWLPLTRNSFQSFRSRIFAKSFPEMDFMKPIISQVKNLVVRGL